MILILGKTNSDPYMVKADWSAEISSWLGGKSGRRGLYSPTGAKDALRGNVSGLELGLRAIVPCYYINSPAKLTHFQLY